jgi:PPK2 family polyphosphate:nucleotide phosphotransferase
MTLYQTEPITVSPDFTSTHPKGTESLENNWPEPDFRKKFAVAPGAGVVLGDIDPSSCDGFPSHESAQPAIRSHMEKIDRLQYLMHAENKRSLLIVLQGVDACGKDGVVRHIVTNMNPVGCRVVNFKQPTPVELGHDFLWRVHPHVPSKGEVTIFNRSHYEDVLVVRVHHLAPVNVWFERYALINSFEKLLVTDNNTTVLKFFLHISKEEQLARFKRRIEDPARRWKISESDYKEREYWDAYAAAFEEMLQRTSTTYAPWYVVPSDNKWFRDLAISQILSRTLDELDMKLPEPEVDIARIRSQYHAAEIRAKAS